MRTPSKAALALAMGLFTATGAGAFGVTSALASPAHSATAHHVSTEVPGTGVDLNDTVDDNGGVTGTAAGDDNGTEVENDADATQLGSSDDPAEPAESEHHGDNSTTDTSGHDQGDDASGDNQGDDQGTDQGDDNGSSATPAPTPTSTSSDGSGDSSGGSDGSGSGSSDGSGSGSGDGGSGSGGGGSDDGGSHG